MRSPEEYRAGLRRAIMADNSEAANELSEAYRLALLRQGVSRAEAGTMVTNEYTSARKAKDTGVLGNFFKGVGSGAVGLGETAALGLAALQEENAELESREKIKSFFGDMRPEGGDPDSLSYKLGSGIGSIAALVPTAAAGKFALPIAGAVSVAAGAGEASERAREEGATEEQRNTASLLGTLVGATEVLPLGRMFKAFEIKALDDLIAVADPKVVDTAMDRVVNAGKTGTVEGLQEFGAAVAQNAIERGYNPDQALVDYQAAEEGGIGAAAGAIFQGVIDTVMPGRRRAKGRTVEDTGTSQEVSTEVTEPSPELDEAEVSRRMAEVTDEQLLGGPEQLPLAPDEIETAEQREQANLAQEDLTATADTEQLAGMSAAEIDAAIEELTKDQQTDPASITEEDLSTMVELQREGAQRSPAPPETPEQLDLFEESRRSEERRENELRNAALVPGEQQDMFAREKGQDTASLMRRKGEEAREQEAETQAREQQEELDTLFAEEDASYQRDLDFAGPQSVRGQQELFPEDPGVEKIQDRESEQRPESPTTETPAQQELAFDRTPGITPPRNQQRRVRKELEKGQQQRQSRKDRQAEARQRLQELVASRRQPTQVQEQTQTGEPTAPLRSPEEIGQSPLATAVRSGLNDLRQQTPQLQQPVKAADSTKVPTVPSTKAKRPAAKQKTAVKPTTSKPVKRKPTKPSPTKKQQEQTTPGTKKGGPAARNVKSVRKGKKNEPVTQPAETTVTEVVNSKKGRELKADRNLKALKDYASKHGGLDAIAYDLAEAGKRRLARKDEPTLDKELSGSSYEKAKMALKALEDAGAKSDVAYINKRMKDPDIAKPARAQRIAQSKGIDETGKSISQSELYEIKDLQRSMARNRITIADLKSEAAQAKGQDKADLLNEVRALEAQIQEARARTKQIRADIKNLPTEALLETTSDVPFTVRSALVGSRLKEAFERLSTVINDSRLRKLVNKLAANAGTTKVVVMKNLTSTDGTDVAGYFDPQSNTIYLDSVDGMNVHTILHETLHAVTSDTLAKKSNIITRQLQKLFDGVKDKLGTAYGSTNLDEFVAESFSNPDFQRMLARVRPDGSPVTAWETFLNTIGNMIRRVFGLDSKPPKSAMSEMDRLVMSIIHPAPTTRPAGELLMVSENPASELNKVEQRLTEGTTLSTRKKWINRAADLVREAPEKMSSVLNRVLQMQGVADLAEHYGLGDIGHRMLKVFNDQRGRQEVMDQHIQERMVAIGRGYDKLSDTQRRDLNTFIYDPDFGATIWQVDVTSKSRASYTNPEQQEAYDQSKAAWDKLDPQAKRTYREMRKFFEEQRGELERTLQKRIDEVVLKTESSQRAGLRDKLTKKLIEASRLEVYFPLMREGDYVVAYKIKDENGFPVEAVRQFEGPSEANLFIQALEGDPSYVKNSVKQRRRSNQAPSIKDVPPTSFMYDILKQMEENGVPKEAISDIVDVYVNTLPEASILKAYKRRQNTIGFNTDVNYVLNRKGYQTGAQIVRLQSVRELGELKTELSDIVSDENMPEKTKIQVQLADELNRRADFVLNGAKNKSFERVVKNLNQGAFVYTIGFNVASAIVNLSQVPMVAFPMLGGKYGYNDTRKALLEASSIVSGARGVSQEKSRAGKAFASASLAHGIDKYFDIKRDKDGELSIDVRTDLDLPEKRMQQLRDIKIMVLEAKKQGQLTSSFLAEALGLEEGGKKAESNWFNKVTGLSAGMFSQAERYNRQTTLLATFNLEKNRLKNEGMSDVNARRQAAQYAIEYTQRINGGSTLETASGLSQEGIGRIALMYKNYGIQMYTMMFQTARQAAKDMFSGQPALQSAAVRQIVGLHGSAIFFSGVYGMPLYGSIAMMYDALKEDDEEDFDTIVQSYMNQGMFRGGVNAMLETVGLDVDAGIRMRMTDLIMQENRFNPNPSPEEQIGGLVGGVALSIGKRFLRGAKDMAEGEYQRGIEQWVPAAITNAMKPFRYAEQDGIRTRRYDLIHGDLSAGEVAAQVIGFAPEQYLRQQEQNRRIKNIDEAIGTKASGLTKKYYVALRTGDFAKALEVRKEISEFNRRNPKFAITPDKIQRSLKGHLRTTEKMFNGVSISKTMQEYLQLQNQDLIDTVVFPSR